MLIRELVLHISSLCEYMGIFTHVFAKSWLIPLSPPTSLTIFFSTSAF